MFLRYFPPIAAESNVKRKNHIKMKKPVGKSDGFLHRAIRRIGAIDSDAESTFDEAVAVLGTAERVKMDKKPHRKRRKPPDFPTAFNIRRHTQRVCLIGRIKSVRLLFCAEDIAPITF